VEDDPAPVEDQDLGANCFLLLDEFADTGGQCTQSLGGERGLLLLRGTGGGRLPVGAVRGSEKR
jgi:hypothetical protein